MRPSPADFDAPLREVTPGTPGLGACELLDHVAEIANIAVFAHRLRTAVSCSLHG
jgi:hypothetical protein